jgi:hypothetical protein
MSRIRNIGALLRGQLWIIPLLLSALALTLAFRLLTTDAHSLKPSSTAAALTSSIRF